MASITTRATWPPIVTQRIFNTRLLTYFLFTYLFTYFLFTYLFTSNGNTLFFPASQEFCPSDNGKTTWSVYNGIVMHYGGADTF